MTLLLVCIFGNVAASAGVKQPAKRACGVETREERKDDPSAGAEGMGAGSIIELSNPTLGHPFVAPAAPAMVGIPTGMNVEGLSCAIPSTDQLESDVSPGGAPHDGEWEIVNGEVVGNSLAQISQDPSCPELDKGVMVRGCDYLDPEWFDHAGWMPQQLDDP
jgi:hypothetical protein